MTLFNLNALEVKRACSLTLLGRNCYVCVTLSVTESCTEFVWLHILKASSQVPVFTHPRQSRVRRKKIGVRICMEYGPLLSTS